MSSKDGKRRFGAVVWVCFCLLFVLSACRSPMYRAAARGDVEAVRAELAAGADPEAQPSAWQRWWQYPASLVTYPVDMVMGLCTLGWYDEAHLTHWVTRGNKSPVDIAWQRGHRAVLSVMADAGATVAPDTMMGKKLLLQEDRYGVTGYTQDSVVRDDVGNENVADCFVRYWSEEDDWTQHRSIYLKHCLWGQADKQGVVVRHPVGRRQGKPTVERPDVLYYRRTGVRSAEVTVRFSAPFAEANKYELSFESPTSGTYRHLYANDKGAVRQFAGRFWLR